MTVVILGLDPGNQGVFNLNTKDTKIISLFMKYYKKSAFYIEMKQEIIIEDYVCVISACGYRDAQKLMPISGNNEVIRRTLSVSNNRPKIIRTRPLAIMTTLIYLRSLTE